MTPRARQLMPGPSRRTGSARPGDAIDLPGPRAHRERQLELAGADVRDGGATVLVEGDEQVDFISARARCFEADGTWPASRAPCAAKEPIEWIHISFDERNVWCQDAAPSLLPQAGRSRRSCSRTTTTRLTPGTR